MVLPSCVESLLLEQNQLCFYLRNVKSFVFREKVALSSIGFGQSVPGSKYVACWRCCKFSFENFDPLWRSERIQLLEKFGRNHENHKRHEGWHTCWTGEDHLWVYTFPAPKMSIKQIEEFSDIILRILRCLAALDIKDAFLQVPQQHVVSVNWHGTEYVCCTTFLVKDLVQKCYFIEWQAALTSNGVQFNLVLQNVKQTFSWCTLTICSWQVAGLKKFLPTME